MKNHREIEFFTFESEVHARMSNGEVIPLTSSEKDLIKLIVDKMNLFYPDAYKALSKEFAKSSDNQSYFRYRIAQRFCKCNFGLIDNTADIDALGRMNVERVQCPLRGECRLEDVVCNPKFNSQISDAEMRVVEQVYHGYEYSAIASKLCLSEHTCRNHIRNTLTRLRLHSKAELVRYVSENNLIKQQDE